MWPRKEGTFGNSALNLGLQGISCLESGQERDLFCCLLWRDGLNNMSAFNPKRSVEMNLETMLNQTWDTDTKATMTGRQGIEKMKVLIPPSPSLKYDSPTSSTATEPFIALLSPRTGFQGVALVMKSQPSRPAVCPVHCHQFFSFQCAFFFLVQLLALPESHDASRCMDTPSLPAVVPCMIYELAAKRSGAADIMVDVLQPPSAFEDFFLTCGSVPRFSSESTSLVNADGPGA